MCGISGFLSKNKTISKASLIKMSEAMLHRGPDAAGYFYEDFVGLGHTRLSIIDVSTQANQPMTSHCGRYVMVFNGEIYNFKEVQKEILLQKPMQFATHSDTEVALEAFALWGIDFITRLNGMFAMAIFDKETTKLSLFRDRVGVKPLYYYYEAGCFAFASEIKGLMAIDFIRNQAELYHESINEFMHLGYIPEPHSIYKNINKFPAGHYAVVSDNGLEIKKYWTPEEQIREKPTLSYHEAKIQLRDLLISSVSQHLICDVPFGTFLSGGADSSLITGIAQSLNDTPINTFSIGFEHSKYNESSYARQVAAHLGTHHHEFMVSEKDAIELIPALTDVFDEPFADSSAIPTMLVSKLARQQVAMTLSGDGGDELFMGYGAYQWAKRLQNPLVRMSHSWLASGMKQLGNKYKRAAEVLDYENREHLKSHIFSQEQNLFSRKEISSLLVKDIQHKISLNENYHISQLSAAEAQALFDLKYYLKDDLLVKVDRASMHYSLETRVPILDYRIVEFALNLPESFKIKGNVQKYLLKQLLYDYIPEHFFQRPKQGFSIPLEHWMKGDLQYLITDYLSDDIIDKYGIFDKKMINDLKHRFLKKNYSYLYNRLWIIIVMNKFLERNHS